MALILRHFAVYVHLSNVFKLSGVLPLVGNGGIAWGHW